jgi:hypothetical protein
VTRFIMRYGAVVTEWPASTLTEALSAGVAPAPGTEIIDAATGSVLAVRGEDPHGDFARIATADGAWLLSPAGCTLAAAEGLRLGGASSSPDLTD